MLGPQYVADGVSLGHPQLQLEVAEKRRGDGIDRKALLLDGKTKRQLHGGVPMELQELMEFPDIVVPAEGADTFRETRAAP